MKIQKAASVPLVLHDPFFSLWSGADHVTDKDVTHWSGVRQKLLGIIEIDGKKVRRLSELLPDVNVIHGDGTDQNLLDRVGQPFGGGVLVREVNRQNEYTVK